MSEEERKRKRVTGEKGMDVTPPEFLTLQVSEYEEPLTPLLGAFGITRPIAIVHMSFTPARRWAKGSSKKIPD